MSNFAILAAVLGITATFSWANTRTVKLPNTIALFILGFGASSALLCMNQLFPDLTVYDTLEDVLSELKLTDVVMHGVLPFLLFSGALRVDAPQLYDRWLGVGSMATIGVFITAAVASTGLWLTARLVGIPLDFIWCCVFGALIAPTDPLAVLAVLKDMDLPEVLKIDLKGETLFNDGIGVVLFILTLQMAMNNASYGPVSIVLFFILQTAGGAAIGLAVGYIAYRAMRGIDDHSVEIVIQLAAVTISYALADVLSTSGPISVVVAGVLIGHHGRIHAMKDETQRYMDRFWVLVDFILNSVVFVLIGLEIIFVGLVPSWHYLAIAAVFMVLLGRLAAVSGAVCLLNTWQRFPKGSIAVLTWGAVRGAIPVALALSLPHGPERPYILTATYATVLFSVVVQALSLRRLAASVVRADEGSGGS